MEVRKYFWQLPLKILTILPQTKVNGFLVLHLQKCRSKTIYLERLKGIKPFPILVSQVEIFSNGSNNSWHEVRHFWKWLLHVTIILRANIFHSFNKPIRQINHYEMKLLIKMALVEVSKRLSETKWSRHDKKDLFELENASGQSKQSMRKIFYISIGVPHVISFSLGKKWKQSPAEKHFIFGADRGLNPIFSTF